MATKQNDKLALIGAPLDLGAKNLGVDKGPETFRLQQIVEKLESLGFKVTDKGDVACGDRASLKPGNPHLRYADEIVRVNNEIAKLSDKAVRAGQRVVVLGGDHSVNLGAVSGASVALEGQLGLLYLDAHGDMNTDKTTLTGNIHGMHLASLMGYGAKALTEVHGAAPKVDKQNLLHIGGSDFDQAEEDFMMQEGLHSFTLFNLLSNGMAPLFRMIDDLAARVPHLWVSLDLDVIDRMYAPGAGMPNAKGLLYREIAAIAEYVGKNCSVVGIDVVEYNPLQDVENKTAELGIELIAKFLGKDYSWYTNYLQKNQVG